MKFVGFTLLVSFILALLTPVIIGVGILYLIYLIINYFLKKSEKKNELKKVAGWQVY